MRVFDHVYAIVPAGGPVTFHAQQRRAFNLLWSLAETKEIAIGGSVGIVGAGLAGMTAAAAAGMLGCKVTLFEGGALPFHQQRGNSTRYIHPNILDWPRKQASSKHTKLPYLNWTADYCDTVIREVEAQWKTVPNVKLKSTHIVSRIAPKPRGARVTVSAPFDQFDFDCVIACIGFGKERTFANVQGTTYWENDALHQFDFSDSSSVLVTGTGDGGLIDLMRLMIADFQHGRIWEAVAAHAPLQALGPAILKADEDARAAGNPSEAGSRLMAAYKELRLEDAFPESLRDSIRSNAKVTLNGSGETPFELSASILNRIITYALLRWHAIEYIDGRLLPTKPAKAKTVTFNRPTEPRRKAFDRIVVRHGPSGRFADLFGKPIADAFLKPSTAITEAGTEEFWPPDYFKPPSFGPEYLELTTRRAAAYIHDMERLALEHQGSGIIVHIGKDNGHATYVVSVPGVLRDGPTEFARIPVIYRQVHDARIEPVARINTNRYRPLVCGIGIQNYDLACRRYGPDADIAFSGTLGCFVETSDGRPAILTAPSRSMRRYGLSSWRSGRSVAGQRQSHWGRDRSSGDLCAAERRPVLFGPRKFLRCGTGDTVTRCRVRASISA